MIDVQVVRATYKKKKEQQAMMHVLLKMDDANLKTDRDFTGGGSERARPLARDTKRPDEIRGYEIE